MFAATDNGTVRHFDVETVKKKRIFIMGDCSSGDFSTVRFFFFFFHKKVALVMHLTEGMKLTPFQVFEPHSSRQASIILL